ncbi:MAG: ABC transporter permease [Patulibacter sp.]
MSTPAITEEQLERSGPGGALRALAQRVGPERLRASLPLATLLVLILYFSATADAFLSTQNFTLITGQAAVVLLGALGATLVIVAGSADFSIGSIALLTGALVARFSNEVSSNLFVVIAFTVAIGALLGLINGIVFAYGRVPSFITTLGTLSLFAGIGLAILGGQAIGVDNLAFQDLATGQLIPNVQNAAVFALVAFAIVWFIARRTRFGLYIYALGGNERVVELAGVKVKRIKVLVLVLSGITAALAGLLFASQLGSAGTTIGASTLLNAFAAIVIGGTALSGGAGGVERTLIGVLILTVLANGLNQLGAQDYTQTIIKGAVIIVAAVFTMASLRKEPGAVVK